MRAEELLARSAATGVDLQGAARVSPPRENPPLEPQGNPARAKETGVRLRPEWTIEEIGRAAAGVPEIQFQAALYAFAGARDNLWTLHAALYTEAQALQVQRGWPIEVCDLHGIAMPYLKHLAKLVLDEDASPNQFVVCKQLYAVYLSISEGTWDKHMAARFDALKYVWLDWLSHAASIIQPRLMIEDD